MGLVDSKCDDGKYAGPCVSTATTTYNFIDNQPFTTSYYRLRQIDNDGKETLSKVIAISSKGNFKLKIYPNPVSNVLTIETDLKDDYQILKEKWGGYAGYDRWFAEPLTNAHLAAVATYHDFVPAFRTLMEQQKTLPKFYAAVLAMSTLDKSARHQQLAQLGEMAPHAVRTASAEKLSR